MEQDHIFDIVLKQDEVTWQSLIYDLIKTNQIDPWDVNVSLLSQKYIEMLKKLKEMDFHVSGKVVLAAAILLKIKSSRLITEDINALDSLFAQTKESEEDGFEDYDDIEQLEQQAKQKPPEEYKLIPRTPQPRRRKVTVYDLMEALQKAMEVKKRRVYRKMPDDIELNIPKKNIDITQIIRDIFGKVKLHFHNKKKPVTFSQLTPGETKEDKVYTFIPLLHLSNSRKIDLHQPKHFEEIFVYMGGKGPKIEYDPEKEAAFKTRKKKKTDKKNTKKRK